MTALPGILKLRVPEATLLELLPSYGDASADADAMAAGAAARAAGELSLAELVRMAEWKFERDRFKNLELIQDNTDAEVRAWSREVLGQRQVILSIPGRKKPGGVGVAMAFVVLHLAHPDPYPVWDERALWSCGRDHHEYTDNLWREYVTYRRGLSERLGARMRVIDRALWGRSKKKRHRLGRNSGPLSGKEAECPARPSSP